MEFAGAGLAVVLAVSLGGYFTETWQWLLVLLERNGARGKVGGRLWIGVRTVDSAHRSTGLVARSQEGATSGCARVTSRGVRIQATLSADREGLWQCFSPTQRRLSRRTSTIQRELY